MADTTDPLDPLTAALDRIEKTLAQHTKTLAQHTRYFQGLDKRLMKIEHKLSIVADDLLTMRADIHRLDEEAVKK